MKKTIKFLQSTLPFVFAALLSFGALQTTIEAASGTGFSAEAITIEDKPEISFSSSFRSAVIGIINYALTFLGLIAVAFIIYAGVLLITDSEGGPEKAKNIILYASAGIILILLSYSIVNLVFGVKETVA